eukprot:scaffold90_cov163-Ochromonas_danica.AAC.28
MIIQLYTVGDLKFGQLKGSDRFGNKYYEDLDLPYGQHRWVEYADIHNPDPTMISPEWHGWMHHVFDETPVEAANLSEKSNYVPVTDESHAIYHTHLGHYDPSVNEKYPQYNISQFRARGYKIGSLSTGPEDKDAYYKQPSHPLSDKVQQARFKDVKNIELWDPNEDLKKEQEEAKRA